MNKNKDIIIDNSTVLALVLGEVKNQMNYVPLYLVQPFIDIIRPLDASDIIRCPVTELQLVKIDKIEKRLGSRASTSIYCTMMSRATFN